MTSVSQQRFYHACRWLLAPWLRRRINLEVIGLEHLPTGAGILVCNHRSNIDPSIVSVAIPRYISWVTAAYMQELPITHWLIQRTGMVLMEVDGPVKPSSFKQALGVLSRGALLGIFPEGERYIFQNDFAAPLADFHRGFAVLALKAQVPIVPMMICPQQEQLTRLTIPPKLQSHIGQSHDLTLIQHIPQYQAVNVVLDKPIFPTSGVRELMTTTRQAMDTLQQQHWGTRHGIGA
ncbi:lysophospholipid acyltransferase family protein [Acaryochloris sp. CCMEE 5410]|uniref:lysophospholipid acyltransferase family protein n=1 Tax=Acaryochloris sp. CCMEE 5410 TaxID=310037 RepID=UPI0002484FB6|nr:lysophospholipid acyltransferase family protein [Acaryochloris sp. CCMEE 5410]KAI9134999.1 1-acyl-sn-glycerol-3-phosphate acyltransferase [Acaryochloris sp. CCMEE 5410]